MPNSIELEAELRELGALGSKESLPEELIPGSLHEALDDYEASIAGHNVRPGSSDLTPYGRLRLARVKRFRKATTTSPSPPSPTTPARRWPPTGEAARSG